MSKKQLSLVLGQINPTVGDLESNRNKMVSIIENNRDADIIIFPEMALVGYPLMDHILDPLIQERNRNSIEILKKLDTPSTVILGTFTKPKDLEYKIQRFYNSAIVLEDEKIKHIENKRLLPNYDVFDERRYFSFDTKYEPIKIKGLNIGLLICEDIWDDAYENKVTEKLVKNGAELLMVINASPYHINKFLMRKKLVCEKAKNLSVPIIYVNMVGGLDEIVYDGHSFISNKYGQIIFKAKGFQEDSANVILNLDEPNSSEDQIIKDLDWREEVVNALTLNLKDYYEKSNIFEGIVLGLSGGIDSAFTAYICAKAIGPEKVNCIMLPTRFTSQQSLDYAEQLCTNLGMKYKIHPIDDLFTSYDKSIKQTIGDVEFDIADENLQARIRATILMYYSNKFKWLLVSTGNKSEIGVGYCTLYGDTNGGKNVPGDLLKVQIYDICSWINREKEIIPKGIITRAPTAELRESQKDSDSLPPYETLDAILKEIIEHGIGSEFEYLQEQGIKLETINKVRKLYLTSEFKRRQLVQSIKVSSSAFGIGRRYPVLKKIKF
ncbi:MAG: NAD+ synthase [Candidatus Lokiarchaeota archaeon]|nr:NAD+ synthase [Candidatus Lokiarchaeota archaeon]MBD3200711.1 NAD+ synthase [Candidatus Lokiarchaeota archaeon]